MAQNRTEIANLALAKLGTVTVTSIDALNVKEAAVARLHYGPSLNQALRDHPWGFALKYAGLLGSYPASNGSFDLWLPDRDDPVTFNYVAGWESEAGESLVTGSVTLEDGSTATRWCVLDNTAAVIAFVSEDVQHPLETNGWVNPDTFDDADVSPAIPEKEVWKRAMALPSDCLTVRSITDATGQPVTAFVRGIGYGKQVIFTNTTGELKLAYTAAITDTTWFDAAFEDALVTLLAARMARGLTGSDAIEQSLLSAYQATLSNARFRDAQTDRSNENRTTISQFLGRDLLFDRHSNEI